MRRETGTQCATDGGHKKSCSGTLSKKGALKMSLGGEQWRIAPFRFVITRTASSNFEDSEKYHPRKEKQPFTICSADEAMKVVPVVEPAKPSKCFVFEEEAFG